MALDLSLYTDQAAISPSYQLFEYLIQKIGTSWQRRLLWPLYWSRDFWWRRNNLRRVSLGQLKLYSGPNLWTIVALTGWGYRWSFWKRNLTKCLINNGRLNIENTINFWDEVRWDHVHLFHTPTASCGKCEKCLGYTRFDNRRNLSSTSMPSLCSKLFAIQQGL